jgi:hypothetical protein
LDGSPETREFLIPLLLFLVVFFFVRFISLLSGNWAYRRVAPSPGQKLIYRRQFRQWPAHFETVDIYDYSGYTGLMRFQYSFLFPYRK